jgi:predicted metalloprotease
MAFWDKITSRGRVDDRRSVSSMTGVGIGGVLLMMGVTYLLGGNPLDVLVQMDPSQIQSSLSEAEKAQYEGVDSYELFASQVLGSADDLWTQLFQSQNRVYQSAELVLFRNYTDSACGGANIVIGPHYCPIDEKVYLDETFFEELRSKFGAQGGDVAEAYVIAHEVGHHVQKQLRILSTEESTNEQSIAVELQADCFAGLWAYSVNDLGVFEFNEIGEAIDAAAAVGDDRIQERVQGQIQPESWTHGSSVARVEAFNKGFTTGSLTVCLS